MSIKFSNGDCMPFDREFFLVQNNMALTLGRLSYVNDVNLETSGGSRTTDVIIGRYSSLSWDLKFSVGVNHVHENVVSTFHFHWTRLRNRFSNYEAAKFNPSQSNNHNQIIIGSDVWIGRGATVMGGVNVGNGAIIGANAMVTKDIPPYAIAIGNPIKIIKYRFDEETRKKFMAVKWWNWDVEKVLANAPLMNDPKKFLEKHYSPELENILEDNLEGGG